MRKQKKAKKVTKEEMKFKPSSTEEYLAAHDAELFEALIYMQADSYYSGEERWAFSVTLDQAMSGLKKYVKAGCLADISGWY